MNSMTVFVSHEQLIEREEEDKEYSMSEYKQITNSFALYTYFLMCMCVINNDSIRGTIAIINHRQLYTRKTFELYCMHG